jgi:hypothetical protein
VMVMPQLWERKTSAALASADLRPRRFHVGSAGIASAADGERGIQLLQKCVRVPLRQTLTAHEQAVVKGSVEGIDGNTDIEIGSELPPLDAAREDLGCSRTPNGDEALSKRLCKHDVMLTLGDQSDEWPANAGVIEQPDDASDLSTQVLARRSRVGKRHLGARVGKKGVHHNRGLARPPPVNGGFAHTGAVGDRIAAEAVQPTESVCIPDSSSTVLGPLRTFSARLLWKYTSRR